MPNDTFSISGQCHFLALRIFELYTQVAQGFRGIEVLIRLESLDIGIDVMRALLTSGLLPRYLPLEWQLEIETRNSGGPALVIRPKTTVDLLRERMSAEGLPLFDNIRPRRIHFDTMLKAGGFESRSLRLCFDGPVSGFSAELERDGVKSLVEGCYAFLYADAGADQFEVTSLGKAALAQLDLHLVEGDE